MLARTLRFGCPSCGRQLQAEGADAGRRAFCPFCQAEVMIPLLRLADEDREAAFRVLQGTFGEPTVAGSAERRTYVRFACEGVHAQLDLRLAPSGFGPRPATFSLMACRVVNLSRGGIALACDSTTQAVAVGGRVRVRLVSPYGPDLTVEGVVVWMRQGSEVPAGEASVGGALPSQARRETLLGVEFADEAGTVGQELSRLERMLVDRVAGSERGQKKQA